MKVKAKLCAVCQTPFIPKQITPVCSYRCARKFNEKKEVEKRVKQLQTGNPNKIALARSVFQTFIRLRDQDLPCISSRDTVSTQWDASHYFKAEIYTGLIFDEDNVHKQRSYDNQYLDGNLIKYREGLLDRIGEERVLALEAKADASRYHKYTREDYQEIIVKYRSKIKELKTASKNAGKPVAEFIKK